MIAVIGHDGLELLIDPFRVMSIQRHVDSSTFRPKCKINMQCETASEEWTLADDAERVRKLVEKTTEERLVCRTAELQFAQQQKRIRYLLELLVECDNVFVAHGYDENEWIRKEVEKELGYT